MCISEFVALRKGVVKEEDISLIEVRKSMCDITLIEVPLAALPCLFKSMCCICLISAKTSSSCLSKAGQLADLDITLIEVASCPASLRSAKSLCYAYALNRHYFECMRP